MLINPVTPRSLPHADKPGSYMLATRVGETNINPGEVLKFEQYITGYGEIQSAKIQCFISSSVFEAEKSIIKNSVKMNEDGRLTWGSQLDYISESGYDCVLQGVKMPGWKSSTLFFDMNESGRIFTESREESAPFEFSLLTKKDIKPGAHYIDFYLRYFNGDEWVVSKERLNFKINSFFERHNTLLSVLAATALFVTIMGDGIAPLLKAVHDIGVFTSEVHSGLRPILPVVHPKS